MKFAVVCTIVLVVLSVLAETNANKAAKDQRREARKQAKQARRAEKMKCAPTATWSTCDAVTSKITQTLTPSTVEGCPAGEQVSNQFDCQSTLTKEKRGCTFVRTTDLTPCGTGAESYTITMTSENCANKIPAKKASRSFPCSRPVKVPKEKPAKKNGKKNRGGKKDKKAKGGNPQQS